VRLKIPSWLIIRHRSTYTYLGWAGLYFLLGIWLLLGGRVAKVFGEVLYADILINLVSPVILSGGGTIAAMVKDRFQGFFGLAWPFLIITCTVTILLPGIWIFKMGGWGTLFSAGLFFSRINWFFLQRQEDFEIRHLFTRGMLGPFLFFAPALIITCLITGRQRLSLYNTDWVPLFGVIYFTAQAAFEEFMLRRAMDKPVATLDDRRTL